MSKVTIPPESWLNLLPPDVVERCGRVVGEPWKASQIAAEDPERERLYIALAERASAVERAERILPGDRPTRFFAKATVRPLEGLTIWLLDTATRALDAFTAWVKR